MMRTFLSPLHLAVFLLGFPPFVFAAPPRVLVENFELELLASEPDIATPIGMAFDREGRLLVVESHTHQRADDYDGPPADRLRLFADSDGDGRLDRWSTFADGFRHAMNVLVRPDGAVYVVSRHKVELLGDHDGDGKADERQDVLRLETETDYPHNALSGIALLPGAEELLVGLGENFGDYYELVGRDGKRIEGQGGRGTVFRCTTSGDDLRPYAYGFWNPFSICVDPFARVFLVDNDPDASPPCRLLHVVPGGDYGHYWQYGRAGTHPLQAWNGELPGTLPMLCGTGEAPTAVVAHRGYLWVTSWGEHRIERYRLRSSGASFSADQEIVVQGDADFRPTGMAIAPDGSLYFGDWIRKDYEVHGQGRIWRLQLPSDGAARFPEISAAERAPPNLDEASVELASSNDPFVRAQLVWHLAHRPATDPVIVLDATKLVVLQAERLRDLQGSQRERVLRAALTDANSDVRLFAVRWVADDRITELRDDVARLLEGPLPSSRYYLAVLAAIDWLDGDATLRGRAITDELLVRELKNTTRSPEAHALALRLLNPTHEFLTLDRLQTYLNAGHEALELEAVRSLAHHDAPNRFELLAEVATDTARRERVRTEALWGLAGAPSRHRDLLQEFAATESGALQREAARILRLAGLQQSTPVPMPPPHDTDAWIKLLADAGDPERGRYLFFGAVGARCSVCHQYGGRGGKVGPDLTSIAQSSSRERIITSILNPSQEIAPHYQSWLLVTDDGKTHVGQRMPKAGDDGRENYADSEGRMFTLASDTIEMREVSDKSIMPDNLHSLLSIDDLRDLIVFLTTPEKP